MSVSGKCNDCFIAINGNFNVSGATTPIYLDVVNDNGQPLSDCVIINSEIIKTNPKMIELDDCGCPINDCGKGSLRINIKKAPIKPVECGFNGFTLDVNGLVLFNLYDNSKTYYMDSECCSSLGYTPELQEGIYVCRWKEIVIVDPCDAYTPDNIKGGYQVFIGPNGATFEVPNPECCPMGTSPELISNGNYKCKEIIVKPLCEGLLPSSIKGDGTVIFKINGVETQYVEATECCTKFNYSATTSNGQIKCVASCETYRGTSYDNSGLITFNRIDGTTFTDVILAQCCPINTTPIPVQGPGTLTYYRCYI